MCGLLGLHSSSYEPADLPRVMGPDLACPDLLAAFLEKCHVEQLAVGRQILHLRTPKSGQGRVEKLKGNDGKKFPTLVCTPPVTGSSLLFKAASAR